MRNPLADPESLHHVGLLNKAEVMLEQRVRATPDDPVVRERLGHIQRALGKLSEAAESFARLTAMAQCPGPVRELHRILTGQVPDTPIPAGAAWPAPFFQVEGFLADREMAELMAEVEAQHPRFAEIPIRGDGPDTYLADPRVRKGACLRLDLLERIVRPKVLDLLPTVSRHLRLSPFAVREMELKVTRHEDGGHFMTHRDDTEYARRISFGCYFHYGERRFAGGDLLLFDTDPARLEPVSYDYTRLAYRFNSAVFFRSDCFHAATEVRLLENTPMVGRYAVIGHVQAATGGGE